MNKENQNPENKLNHLPFFFYQFEQSKIIEGDEYKKKGNLFSEKEEVVKGKKCKHCDLVIAPQRMHLLLKFKHPDEAQYVKVPKRRVRVPSPRISRQNIPRSKMVPKVDNRKSNCGRKVRKNFSYLQ